MPGMIGKKIGMSQVLSEDGAFVPVTFVLTEPNEILQVKTKEKDGYAAIVLGYDPYKNPSKNRKFKILKEFRIENEADFQRGGQVKVEALQGVGAITVTAISKGKGFQGNTKRHNFAIIRETHGTKYARHGSTGCRAMPGRTKKGQKMPGRMGGDNVTLKNRKVIFVDQEKNIVALKGAIPGAINTYVYLKI